MKQAAFFINLMKASRLILCYVLKLTIQRNTKPVKCLGFNILVRLQSAHGLAVYTAHLAKPVG